ncbi:MAG TPA: COX15/CtaA family protein, partial [Alphaproteobacteria bacterium]|nr:COX15/CtaA family protein [Alphaproteobacteria bacterium]
PPLNEEQWQNTFERYQRFPEYRKVNRGMTLPEFRRIFYFEYAHRMLGRFIGLAFAVPFLGFLATGRIARRHVLPLAGLFLLGGLQGGVGWWMVKSGLIDHPDVSQYRLATHLGLAVAILAALTWYALSLLYAARPVERAGPGVQGLARGCTALLGLVYLQILLGALVAGLDGGFVYNSFPDMNGYAVPPEVGQTAPLWLDMLSNPVTVQFDHRIGAYAVVLSMLAFWAFARRTALPRDAGRGIALMLGVLALQFSLGVLTVLYVVPVPLGVAHQGGALLLFLSVLYTLHRLRAAARV